MRSFFSKTNRNIKNFSIPGQTLITLAFSLFLIFAISFIMNSSYVSAGNENRPDPDVTYISRTPRYYRFKVDYPKTRFGIGIPVLAKGTETQKRMPLEGETVIYTAHIINKGNVRCPGFDYLWLVNGKPVKKGIVKVINPGREETVKYSCRWKDVPQKIEFRIDTGKKLREICKKNNSLTIGSHDLTLSIWAEQGIYDIFNRTKNRVGSYSFEDWIQNHFAVMNQRFAQAKYDVSPDGILDRVRIDKIVVAEDLDGPGNPLDKDPDQFLIDGRWQFKDNSHGNINGKKGAWQDYVNLYIAKTDWGLIHEMAHQLGVIDLYRMNLINDKKRYPNNGIHVLDKSGKKIPVTKLPTCSWHQVLFKNPGIMAGGDTSPYKDSTYFSSHTAAGMNTNYLMRRGYYGDYLFDTPAKTSLKILDKSGKPVAGAMVEMFQKDAQTEVIDNKPEIKGRTNGHGIIQLPNRKVDGVTTETMHTLKPNPFGQIHVVGTNGTMLLRVTQGGKTGYGWLFIIDLNMAYWKGKKNNAVITINTSL